MVSGKKGFSRHAVAARVHGRLGPKPNCANRFNLFSGKNLGCGSLLVKFLRTANTDMMRRQFAVLESL